MDSNRSNRFILAGHTTSNISTGDGSASTAAASDDAVSSAADASRRAGAPGALATQPIDPDTLVTSDAVTDVTRLLLAQYYESRYGPAQRSSHLQDALRRLQPIYRFHPGLVIIGADYYAMAPERSSGRLQRMLARVAALDEVLFLGTQQAMQERIDSNGCASVSLPSIIASVVPAARQRYVDDLPDAQPLWRVSRGYHAPDAAYLMMRALQYVDAALDEQRIPAGGLDSKVFEDTSALTGVVSASMQNGSESGTQRTWATSAEELFSLAEAGLKETLSKELAMRPAHLSAHYALLSLITPRVGVDPLALANEARVALRGYYEDIFTYETLTNAAAERASSSKGKAVVVSLEQIHQLSIYLAGEPLHAPKGYAYWSRSLPQPVRGVLEMLAKS